SEPPAATTVVRERGKFTITCKVPLSHVPLWLKDGVPVAQSQGYQLQQEYPTAAANGTAAHVVMRLSVERAQLSHAGDYKCSSFSPHSQRILVVAVNAVQTNEEIPGKGIVMDTRSKSLVLQCNFTENPGKPVDWYKDGVMIPTDGTKYSPNSDTNTLVVNDPSYADAGNYTCAVMGGDNATIVVQTNVTIDVTDISKNQVEGDPLTLSCKAYGVPVPEVSWFKNDEPLNISDPRISLEPLENVTNAKLVIQDLNFDDRAEYTCFATNGISNATMMVLVRVKDKLAALWPFLGICVEVAVLCAIIFIYEKKRVKPDFEESDTDQNPENKNLSDQKEGQDIRQRK
ncbi:unnamed protein product, partial [Ixodes hexagonus]